MPRSKSTSREKRKDNRTAPRVCAICGHRGGGGQCMIQEADALRICKSERVMKLVAPESPWMHQEPCYQNLANRLAGVTRP